MTSLLSCYLPFVLLLWPLIGQGQCLSGDCRNGEGRYQLPGGTIYEGDFSDSEIHGVGLYRYPDGTRLFTEWQHRYPIGKGRLLTPDGRISTGRWSGRNLFYDSGPESGELLFRLDAADIQSGCLQGDCQNGQGNYAYVDGSRYQGAFQSGMAEGIGAWFYPNGEVHRGHFHQNLPHGEGLRIKPDGTKTEGVWKNGILTRIAGRLGGEEGCREGDCRDGYGAYYFAEQQALYRGAFADGLPTGYGTAEYANGEKYYGQWAAGSFDGPGTLVLLDGTEITGFWSAGAYQRPLSSSEQPSSELANTTADSMQVMTTGRVYALIIGVSAYQHMPPLSFSDDDAYRLYAFLQSPEGSAVPADHIQLLIDEDATYRAIHRSLDSLSGMMGAEDLLLVYFSGHGLPEAWLPVDFNGMENRFYYEELIDRLGNLPARQIFLIMDACHSGSLYPGSEEALSRNLGQFRNLSEKRFAIISSAKAGESALEARGLRQGVFSHFLLRGLKGEADLDRDDQLKLGELFGYVEYNVRHFTRQVQSPRHFGRWDPDVVLPFSLKKNGQSQ